MSDEGRQGFGAALYDRVVITVDHGSGKHPSFEAHDPEGQTLTTWQAKVLAERPYFGALRGGLR